MVVKSNKWQSPPFAVRSGIDKLMERFGYVNVYFRWVVLSRLADAYIRLH